MTDRKLQHLLVDYINGRLDEATCREIELRLERSADLRRAFNAAKLYADAVGAIEPVQAPDDFLQKVHDRIQKKRSLIDSLFTPLHGKLPIELVGVAVTVLLVVLLFNPFSGRLPLQMVKNKAPHYTEIMAPPPQVPEAVVSDGKKNVASKPTGDDASSDVADKKSALRQSPLASIRKSEAQKSRKRPADPFESATGTPAPKASPPVRQIEAVAEQTPVPTPVPAQNFSITSEKLEESAVAQTERGIPATSTPSLSSPPSPRMAAEIEAAAGMRTDEYELVEAKEAAAYDVDTGSQSMMKKSLKRTVARKRQSVALTDQQEHAPVISAPMENRDTIDTFESVANITRRYRGAIDTVFIRSPAMISLRITIPIRRFEAYKNALSEEFEMTNLSFSSFEAHGKDIAFTLGVRRP